MAADANKPDLAQDTLSGLPTHRIHVIVQGCVRVGFLALPIPTMPIYASRGEVDEFRWDRHLPAKRTYIQSIVSTHMYSP